MCGTWWAERNAPVSPPSCEVISASGGLMLRKPNAMVK